MVYIHGFMNIYEEKTHIIEALNNIKNYVDELWILDGTVKQFPAKPDYNSYAEAPASRDGTVEMIKEWVKTSMGGRRLKRVHLYESNEIWETEADKKNFLLRKIPFGALTLQLDGDEEIYGEIPEQLPQSGAYSVYILFRGHASFKPLSYNAFPQPRIFINDRTRFFVPPNRAQLIKKGQFFSIPIKGEEFSGEEYLTKIQQSNNNPPTFYSVSGTKYPQLPIFIVNNPSVRELERQKRRLIYYERIFGVKFF